MFKFAIILGCALLATSAIAAVVDTFDVTDVIHRIDTAIEDIGIKARDVRKAVLEIGIRGNNSVHAYVNSLKTSMNVTLQSIQSTIADLKGRIGERFDKNECGTYLDDLMDVGSVVQDEMDGCTLISIIPSAFELSEAFSTSAKAIESLDKIRALVATCNARKCQGLEGEEVIKDPTAFRNTILSHVKKFADDTCAAIQTIQDDYQHSVQDAHTIYDCVRHNTDYNQFLMETSNVLLDTAGCVADSAKI